jgi:hypothetical protein
MTFAGAEKRKRKLQDDLDADQPLETVINNLIRHSNELKATLGDLRKPRSASPPKNAS